MKRFLLLITPVLLTGCVDPIYDSLDEESTSTGTTTSTTGPPEPTTGSSTLIVIYPDMAVEPESTDAAASLEIVAFSASTDLMSRAGSVVLTAEVEGDVSEMLLQVQHNGEDIDGPGWPVGEVSREFIVNSDSFDGELTFTLTAQSDQLSDTAAVSVDVDLPKSGTKNLRWVSPSVSRGIALGVVPKSGTEGDRIVVFGNDDNDVLLMGELEYGGVSTFSGTAMEVHGVDVAGEFIYVTGELDGNMVTRAYNADTKQAQWANHSPDSRGLDVAVGPDGEVYVVGQTYVNGNIPHVEGTVWTLKGSTGAFFHDPVLFAAYDVMDWPFSSGLRAVGIHDGRVVAVGYREVDIGVYPPRATLFEFVDGQLIDRDVYSGTFVKEMCGWYGLVTTEDGIVATGWHRTKETEPVSVAFGRYGEDLTSEVFSPAWGGFGAGNAVAWQDQGDGYPVIAGHRTVDDEPRLMVQAESWGEPYIDDAGDRSWAHDVAVDRHGYVYVIGELVEDGASHMILVRLNP